jgi:hypothetical protein
MARNQRLPRSAPGRPGFTDNPPGPYSVGPPYRCPKRNRPGSAGVWRRSRRSAYHSAGPAVDRLEPDPPLCRPRRATPLDRHSSRRHDIAWFDDPWQRPACPPTLSSAMARRPAPQPKSGRTRLPDIQEAGQHHGGCRSPVHSLWNDDIDRSRPGDRLASALPAGKEDCRTFSHSAEAFPPRGPGIHPGPPRLESQGLRGSMLGVV